MKHYENLTYEQRSVFKRLINGENIYIAGNAGTGKSYLVTAFDEWCSENRKQLVKVAPTGVAASEIDGATIHKQFGFDIGIDEMLKKQDRLSTKQEFLLFADTILIDEISMVRLDMFDRLMQVISVANYERKNRKKKELQLIFVGDFYQLPPVVTPNDREYLMKYYKRDVGNAYCFQSKYWRLFNVQMVNLQQVIRQSDADFCNALDQCKIGDADCLAWFKSHFAKVEQEGAIWVVGKNATADDKNRFELAKIKGEEYVYNASYVGEATIKDKLCDDSFTCKIGAKVVILVNDTENMEYQNGTIGTIREIVYEEGKPVIVVRLSNGYDARIGKKKFSKYNYELVDKTYEIKDEKTGEVIYETRRELKKKEIGSVTQFPLRLGYAVTVHKSQGQTYDAMNFKPEIFSDGQLYVALSRCKEADKCFVDGYISNYMVRTAKEVTEFYNEPEEYSFFEKDEVMKQILVPEKYLGRIKQLITKWDEEEGNVFGFDDTPLTKAEVPQVKSQGKTNRWIGASVAKEAGKKTSKTDKTSKKKTSGRKIKKVV